MLTAGVDDWDPKKMIWEIFGEEGGGKGGREGDKSRNKRAIEQVATSEEKFRTKTNRMLSTGVR